MGKIKDTDEAEITPVDSEQQSRRDFLIGLKKWSRVVIGGAVAAAAIGTTSRDASAWVNRRGGWANRGGGGSWANRSGGWANRGGSWANGRSGGWVNRRGGGGAWVNR